MESDLYAYLKDSYSSKKTLKKISIQVQKAKFILTFFDIMAISFTCLLVFCFNVVTNIRSFLK